MTMKDQLLKLLKTRWVSPIDALRLAGCLSLSQRCGEMRRDGVNVIDKWCEANGKRFKSYRIMK